MKFSKKHTLESVETYKINDVCLFAVLVLRLRPTDECVTRQLHVPGTCYIILIKAFCVSVIMKCVMTTLWVY